MALQEIIRNVQRRSRSDESEDSGKSEYDFSKPFRVKIVSDCRDVEEKLNGQWGNYRFFVVGEFRFLLLFS
jgi:hypothetical protein